MLKLGEPMRAAVYRDINRLEIEEVPIPEIGTREVLVQVAVCGVCGTDLKKIRYGLVPPPRIFGHETAGTIVQVGQEVRNWKVGDRVVVNHHVPCQREDCFYCRRKAFAQCPIYKKTGATAGFEPAGGGYAEYVRVLDFCVDGMVRVPDEVPLEEASLIEPLNTCLKGVRIADLQADDTVVIIGQGPIGMLFTLLAKRTGAKVVATDRIESRLGVAKSLGADSIASNDEETAHAVRTLSEGRGADLVIVAVPITEVIPQAFNYLRTAGKILLFAQTRLQDMVAIDAGQICMQEKALLGSYSSDITLQDETAELIFSRKVDVRPLLTHTFPLEAISEAIEIAERPRDNSLKILVTP